MGNLITKSETGSTVATTRRVLATVVESTVATFVATSPTNLQLVTRTAPVLGQSTESWSRTHYGTDQVRVRTDTLQHLTTENVLDLVDTLVARIVVQTLSAVVGVLLVSVGTGDLIVDSVLVQKSGWYKLQLGPAVLLVTTQNVLVDRRLPSSDIVLVDVKV